MAEMNDDINISYSLTYDASPIAHRYMMACPGHLRRRRLNRLIPHACETVLRTLQLGGRMYSGGALNTEEFASAETSEEAMKWRSVPFHITVAKEITPYFYEAVKDKSLDDCKKLIHTCFEAYVLTIGATTLPSDQVRPLSLSLEGSSSDTDGAWGSRPATGGKQAAVAHEPPSPVADRADEEPASEPAVTEASAQVEKESASTPASSPSEKAAPEAKEEKPTMDADSKRIRDMMRQKGPAS